MFVIGLLGDLPICRPHRGDYFLYSYRMKSTGLTTTQFIARTRISEACRRINTHEEYGDYTLEAIWQSIGYPSRSHFGNVFRRFVVNDALGICL